MLPGRLTVALTILLSCLAPFAFAASNVVQYTYDAAGNIVEIKRQSPGGFAITSFDPTSGAVGAAVTIYGAGFSATPSANAVAFNGTAATVSASAAGSISTTVPAGATTGRITVTVGGVTATSAQDFVVVIPGAPTIASFTPVSGVAGNSISVTGTNFNTTAGATTVKVNGVTATSSVASATALSFTVPGAAGTGRITATTSTGTGTSAQDFLIPPPGLAATDIASVRRIVNGGVIENISIYEPNKHILLLFDGAQDGFHSLQFTQFESSPTSATVNYKIYKPDNTLLGEGAIGFNIRTTIHIPQLPAAGTYAVLISPGLATLNTLVKLASDTVLAVDGASAPSGLTYQNQTKRFIFAATAGQRIGIGVLGVTHSPANANRTTFKGYKPDGTLMVNEPLPYCLQAGGFNPQGNCDGELLAPVAGNYQMVAESPINSYSTFTAQLSSEVTGALSPNVLQDVTLARAGQDARISFTGAAGDSIGIDMSAVAVQPTQTDFAINFLRPDGTPFPTPVPPCSGFLPTGTYCDLGTLATAGTYTVTIDGANGNYGSFKLAAKQGALITATDSPAALATTANGESARFRFSATAAQNLTVGITGLANTPTSSTGSKVSVYGPGRVQFGSTVTCTPTTGACKVTLNNAPQTGTYSIVVQPNSAFRIAGNVTLSTELTGSLSAGVAQSINAARAGQNARYTFAGTAGDSSSIKLYGISTTPASQTISVTVYRPNGSLYLSNAAASPTTPIVINMGSLPVTGTYSVFLEPASGATWQAQLMLDAGPTLTVDGATVTPTGSSGEPLRYRFAGTTGQRLEVGVSGLAYTPTGTAASTLELFRPDGISMGSASCPTSGAGACEFNVASLPSTGTFALTITPPAANALSAGTLALSTPATGTLTIGAAAQTIAVTRPAQTARYTFSGTASQLLRLNWAGTTVSGGASVAVSVLKPDGVQLSAGNFVTGATGGFDIASLPSTGTYTVVLDSTAAATFSAPVTLVTR